MSVTTHETARKPRPWDWGPYSRESTVQTVSAFLWTLHDLGGEVTDSSGRCGSLLQAKAAELGMPFHPIHTQIKHSGLSSLTRELVDGKWGGSIERDTNSKRTHRIKLLLTEEEMPQRPFPVVTKRVEPTVPPAPKRPAIGDTRPAPFPPRVPTTKVQSVFGRPTPAPAATPRPNHVEANGGTGPRPADPTPEPEPAPEPEPERTLAVVDEEPRVTLVEPNIPPLVALDGDPVGILLEIQRLSMSAVMAVAANYGTTPEAIAPDPTERDEQAKRLAVTLEENNRLRRKVNEGVETLQAKVKEIEALRKALNIAQSNLRAMQEASNVADKERAYNRLTGNQKFIAARPEPAIAARR